MGNVPWQLIVFLIGGALVCGMVSMRRIAIDDEQAGFFCLLFTILLNAVVCSIPHPWGWSFMVFSLVLVGQILGFLIGLLITPTKQAPPKADDKKVKYV